MNKLYLILTIFIALTKSAEANVFPNALERFEVEDLKAVSIKKDKETKQFYAFVLDPDGYAYKAEIGDYLGKDRGKIRKIDPCGIWFQEIRQDSNGDWGIVDRVMFGEDALYACKRGLPKEITPVNREASKLARKKDAEKSALKIFFKRHGLSKSNLSEQGSFSIPLISGIYSFPFDDGWVVVVWDSLTEKKTIFEIYVLNKRGRVVVFGMNGPKPDGHTGYRGENR